MIIVFSVFVLVCAIFLLPSQLTDNHKRLGEVQQSLSVRLLQLKSEFQFRTKELKRRLNSGDLAESEWQQLNQELLLDTSKSIESTEQAKINRKLETSTLAGLVMLAVVALVGLGFFQLSASTKLAAKQIDLAARVANDPQAIQKLMAQAEQQQSQQTLEDLYLGLRLKLEQSPMDIQAWRDFSSFNMRVGHFEVALNAIEKAIKLDPENVDLLVEQAQIYASQNDPKQRQLAQQQLTEIVARYPHHEGARLVFAFNAFNLANYPLAIEHWQSLLQRRDPESSSAKMLQQSIALATEKMSQQSDDTEDQLIAEAHQASSSAMSTAMIKVEVNLSEQLKQSLTGNETLFVFAKAIEGPQFPLAVVKLKLTELSGVINLSDKNAMQPTFKLSDYSQVKVSARISRSGNAIAQPGDRQSESLIVAAPFNAKPITLYIN